MNPFSFYGARDNPDYYKQQVQEYIQIGNKMLNGARDNPDYGNFLNSTYMQQAQKNFQTGNPSGIGGDYSTNYFNTWVYVLFDQVRGGNLDYIKTVDPYGLLNARDLNGSTVLIIATQMHHSDLCYEILNKCPSLLYHHDNYKMSVLHIAAQDGNYRLIDFFVRTGLEAAKSEGGTINMKRFKEWINLKDSTGNTAFILAVRKGSHDIVKCFLEEDRQYMLGLTDILAGAAMEWAILNKDHEMINILTGSRDPNLNNNGANTDGGNFSNGMQQPKEPQAKSSGTGVTMMDKFHVEVCDTITSSLSKLANDKPQPYSRAQLKEFTKDFSQRLGFGGFGDVYKGQFPNGVFIAVKVLKNIEFMEKVMEEQFVAEVDTMGRAYHCNLIKLYGYCYEAKTKYKALVYDYMENGSFDTILFEKKLDIPWAKLHNIAKEIAQGISYLHESCKPQIIHQDLKPANVLLDTNLSPKVIDFGLAKVNTGESQYKQMKIKGSRNYMAPEVNQLQPVNLSCKLDVYSFGMILFDILGCKRNHVDKSWFPGQVWEKYKTNQLDKFILECGIKDEDKENAKRLAMVALLCVEHNPRDRPMLSNVVKMLEGKINLVTPVVPFYPDYYSSESSSMNDSRDG